ncbi:hypothetical protein SDC9_207202 [bioreactor metagenome]|uniref:Uncharacterized protein n=1 Tax=bioreactor metagenome TaxID=1076179 RepID=A0A645J790_9ZZZZ
MPCQPVAEQRGDFVRQAQDGVARTAGAMVPGPGEQVFEFLVVQARDQWRDEYADRDAGGSQFFHCFQACVGRAGARLELPRQCSVQCGQRNGDVRQVLSGQFGPQIGVANDE